MTNYPKYMSFLLLHTKLLQKQYNLEHIDHLTAYVFHKSWRELAKPLFSIYQAKIKSGLLSHPNLSILFYVY